MHQVSRLLRVLQCLRLGNNGLGSPAWHTQAAFAQNKKTKLWVLLALRELEPFKNQMVLVHIFLKTVFNIQACDLVIFLRFYNAEN